MKRIAVIQDLSGFGRCSLTAAIPVISVMGMECCPLPTAILSNQTGYPSFFCDDYTKKMDVFIAEWKKLGVHFDAILTGYLASAEQAEKITEFLRIFRTPDTLFFCDPVMADDGKIYDTYDSNLCRAVAELAETADVITPNLTELCLLTNRDFNVVRNAPPNEIAALAASLLSDTRKHVIITGVHTGRQILNICVSATGVEMIGTEKIGGSYSGTGDLFSAAVCGKMTSGHSASDAVKLAAAFIEKAIRKSYKENTNRNDGVNFQTYLEMLL